MNKKTIIGIIIGSIAVVGLMAWGYGNLSGGPTRAELNTPSSLTTQEALYDFGSISMSRGKVDHMFRVTNPTDKDVLLKDLSTSCMCTEAYIVNGSSKEGPFGMPGMGGMTATNAMIVARGTRDIDIVFDPAAHGPAGIGNIDRFAYLTDAGGATLRLEIKAIVTP